MYSPLCIQSVIFFWSFCNSLVLMEHSFLHSGWTCFKWSKIGEFVIGCFAVLFALFFSCSFATPYSSFCIIRMRKSIFFIFIEILKWKAFEADSVLLIYNFLASYQISLTAMWINKKIIQFWFFQPTVWSITRLLKICLSILYSIEKTFS